MPIFIFEKEAHNDLVQILRNRINLPEMVIHSFSGKIEELQDFLKLGCYIGLTGKLVFILTVLNILVRFTFQSCFCN